MSESLLDQQADLQGLSTAILLPSVDLLGTPIRGAVGPLTPIVGIGLFQRAVLTFQRAGIRQLIVVAGAEEDALKQALGRGPRVTIPVRWMPIREFPLDDPRTWEALASEVRGFCLVSGAAGIFSRALVEQLRRDVQEGQAIVVGPARHRLGAVRDDIGSIRRSVDSGLAETADLVVLPASLLSAAGSAMCEAGAVPVRRWIEQAAATGKLRVFPTESNHAQWYRAIRNSRDVRAAESQLFASLTGDLEGLVDRYFNRILSRRFTRIFLSLGLSPNAVTMLATLVGLTGAAGFAMGTYAAGIAGAVLFQLAAVIDCSDGEIARLTFTESSFGAWLDIAMDNVVHMAIFGGIAWGSYAAGSGFPYDWAPLVLGGAAILGNALSFALVGKAQKIRAANGWNNLAQAARSEFILRNVASRDFSVIVLLFALLGKLDWFLWLAAIGSLVFATIMLWVVRFPSISRD